jgi:hypothetical protein
MTGTAPRDGWTWLLGFFALGNIANGLWMLADAAGWYVGLPAAVPDFGPLNEHFIRDIGAAYATLGIGLAWAAVAPAVRLPVLLLVTMFYGLHALGHVYDTAAGTVGPEHWRIDFFPIYVPAVVLVALTVRLARRGA